MSKSNHLAMLSALMVIGASTENDFYKDYEKPKQIERLGLDSTFKPLSEEQKQIKKGLKKFEYENGSVYALNQKNADKKARKLNLL